MYKIPAADLLISTGNVLIVVSEGEKKLCDINLTYEGWGLCV